MEATSIFITAERVLSFTTTCSYRREQGGIWRAVSTRHVDPVTNKASYRELDGELAAAMVDTEIVTELERKFRATIGSRV